MKHRQHGITKGFSVYKRFQDRIEVWSFAGKDAKGIPSIATQTSILLFQNFIAYFNKQQKVNHLSCPFVNYAQSFDMSYNIPSDIQVESFNTSIHADKFTLEIKDKLVSYRNENGSVFLSLQKEKLIKVLQTYYLFHLERLRLI